MVRTSLDPALQLAAEKNLRDGLMAYDRKMGGWRGAVAHLTLPPADFADSTVGGAQRAAAAAGHAAGLEDRDRGRTDRRRGQGRVAQPGRRTGGRCNRASGRERVRPLREGKPGPAPEGTADIVQVGDVVMYRAAVRAAQAATCAAGGAGAKGKAPACGTATGQPGDVAKYPWFRARSCRRSADRAGLGDGWRVEFRASQFNRATQANRQPGPVLSR